VVQGSSVGNHSTPFALPVDTLLDPMYLVSIRENATIGIQKGVSQHEEEAKKDKQAKPQAIRG
jgi:hypothetical protein